MCVFFLLPLKVALFQIFLNLLKTPQFGQKLWDKVEREKCFRELKTLRGERREAASFMAAKSKLLCCCFWLVAADVKFCQHHFKIIELWWFVVHSVHLNSCTKYRKSLAGRRSFTDNQSEGREERVAPKTLCILFLAESLRCPLPGPPCE